MFFDYKAAFFFVWLFFLFMSSVWFFIYLDYLKTSGIVVILASLPSLPQGDESEASEIGWAGRDQSYWGQRQHSTRII